MKKVYALMNIIVVATALFTLVAINSTNAVSANNNIYNVKKYKYFKTNKRIALWKTQKHDNSKYKKLFVPKGVVVYISESEYIYYKKGIAYGTFNSLVMSYKRAKRVTESATTKSIPVKLTKNNFTPVKKPNRYTLVALWSGNANIDKKGPIYVTADGYLQYYNNPQVVPFGAKPNQTAKIVKFKNKGNSTYLYLKKRINGLKEKKVAKGVYRLRITNLKKRVNSRPDDEGTYTRYAMYSVGGKAYKIPVGGNGEDD